MIEEPQNRQQSQQKDRPTVRPIYSTSEYSDKRNVPPPPPSDARGSAMRDRSRRRKGSRTNSAGEWAWVIVVIALFAVGIVISLGAFTLIKAAQENIEVLPTADVSSALPTPVVAYNDFDNTLLDDTLVMADGSSIDLIPWDGESRFTFVMVGLDRRPGDTGLQYRTDTMMLVSIDPDSDDIGILSIPRDLYVQIPGYPQLQRINTAMFLGEIQRQGFGPTLMMQTVQFNLGIRVHDYIAVDFQAFIDVVNAIGGINVTTTYVINDPQYPDMNYGYDPLYIPVGTHHLDGYDALRFARTRHGSSDIRRAERQQQALYAIRDRILDFDMVPSLIAQAPLLWNSWGDNISTGLSFEQIIQLSLYAKDVPRDQITMGVISFEYLQSYTTGAGAQVLIPNRSRLGNLMVDIFGPDYSQ
ncbi:MAG: LCP family protein [Anaerolineae bacterium]|nr:LCP family protein [Anaerolineae bacterium]